MGKVIITAINEKSKITKKIARETTSLVLQLVSGQKYFFESD